jgi:uncharacterized protein (DUF362 family)
VPDKIVIKPNLCYYWDSSTGQTTSPLLVAALIDFLRDYYSTQLDIVVAEADASAMKTKHAFKMLGYEKLVKEKEIRLVNLSMEPVKEISANVGNKQIQLSFSEELLDADIIVNMPKLKYHRLPKVTGAMKNIFGAIAKPNKFSYHKQLYDIIVASNKAINSDLVLVDGLVALGSHPKILNTLIMGTNAFETDCILSKLLGFNPNGINYLKIGEKEGLGRIRESNKYWNGSFYQISKELPKPNYLRQKISWDAQLFFLKLYSKIIGDVIPPMLIEE